MPCLLCKFVPQALKLRPRAPWSVTAADWNLYRKQFHSHGFTLPVF
jgi:hypothetical protein